MIQSYLTLTMEAMMKLLLTVLVVLAACGNPVTQTEETAPVSSMQQIQTALAKPTTPAPEQPQKKAVRKRLELTVGSDWIVRGTGAYSGGTLASLPTLPSCLEYASAFGGGGQPAAEYAFALAPRLEQVVQLPPEALAADDLSVAPLVTYTHTVGLPAKFVGVDNLHCTEQSIAVSEFRFEAQGSPWQPTYAEYAGASSNPPKGATALRLRLRLHGQTSITPVSVKLLLLYTVWE